MDSMNVSRPHLTVAQAGEDAHLPGGLADCTGSLTELGGGLAHRVALAALLASTLAPEEGSPLSGQALGGDLRLSREAVHKQVKQLRSLGFAVEAVPRVGYRLNEPFSDLVVPEAVLPYLFGLVGKGRQAIRKEVAELHRAEACSEVGAKGGSGQEGVRTLASSRGSSALGVGVPYHYLTECRSTNAVARELVAKSPSGTVIVTDRQTGGRGRLGRSWLSESGKDLTFSVILRPALTPAQAQLLSLAAAVAVAEVLEERFGLQGRVGLKWPNDVLLEGRKVCGVLVEGSLDVDHLHWVVVGIGLNVNSQASRLPASARAAGLDHHSPDLAGQETLPSNSGPEAKEWQGRPQPIALGEYLGRRVERAVLLAALLARLGDRFASVEKPAGLLAAWRARDVLVGRLVEVTTSRGALVVSGTAEGLGPQGQLLVRETVPVKESGLARESVSVKESDVEQSRRGPGAEGRVIQVFAGDVSVLGLPTVEV